MKKVMILGAALFLTACSGQQFTQQLSPGKLVGAAAGAFVGGYAGSQVGGGVGRLLFTVAGAVIGGGAGYSSANNCCRPTGPSSGGPPNLP